VTTTAQITAESTMQEVLGAYPGAQRALMRRYHIGGCSSCGFSPDVDEVISHIKESHEQELRMRIHPQELAEQIKSPEPPKLIDVRTAEEQAICKLDSALPATQELVQEMMSDWSKDTPIVVYCHKGVRSLDAASYLIGHGFTNVKTLSGGIDAWAQHVDSSVARY